MNLPFTTDQFLHIFEQYNLALWPAQILLNLIAVVALVLAVKRPNSDKTVGMILAFLWLWIGTVYHLIFFSSINPAAILFGILNIVQALLFTYYTLIKPKLSFAFAGDVSAIVGTIFIFYALIIYPVIGYFLGPVYPKSPTFGLPCPTTIFTFGLLLWTSVRVPKALLIIPFVWSVIGFSAALTMGIHEDIGLLVAGVIGTAMIIRRDAKR